MNMFTVKYVFRYHWREHIQWHITVMLFKQSADTSVHVNGCWRLASLCIAWACCWGSAAALCAEWHSALNGLFWRTVEECRESREPVVNIIKGWQVSASHAITPDNVLSYVGLWCGHHCKKDLGSICQAGIDFTNISEISCFWLTRYPFTVLS